MSLLGYLAERERIEQGATKGPWDVCPCGKCTCANTRGPNGVALLTDDRLNEGVPLPDHDERRNNVIFAADARTAVPTLVAMVREATEALRQIASAADDVDTDVPMSITSEVKRALARLDAMATEDAT